MFIPSGELVTISKHKNTIKYSFFKTLRFRIVVIMLLLGIVPSIIITNAMMSGYENLAVTNRRAIVKNQCDMLCNQLIAADYLNNPTDTAINSKINMLTSIYSGRIQIIDKDYRILKDTFNIDTGKYMISSVVIDCFNGIESNNYDSDNDIVEMAIRVTDPNDADKGVVGVMLISFTTKEINNTRVILEKNGMLVLGIIILLIIIFGLLFSGILVKPFKKITNAIEAMAVGYKEEPLSVNDYQETKQITDAFNRLIKQVREMDDNRQEFVSNVSHELKTPLASMKVLADSLNMNPDATLDQYKEFMEDISAEINRENAIITDLLSLVSMDKDATDLNIEPTNINELIELVIKRLKPIADQKNVELRMESFRNVEAEIDSTKITLVVSNIVENAIKYNKPEGGWVNISLNADNKYFYLTISDSGIGIPEESLERIFDRFYRVDKSHSRAIGGTGLGLAITKSAINLHKGAIRVSSTENEGTTFSIRIPLVHMV